MNKGQLVRNILSTSRIIVENLSDDPSYFGLQVARKFKGTHTVQILNQLMRHPLAGLRMNALSATLRDDKSSLLSSCQTWLQKDKHRASSVFLVNLCVAAGEWDLAVRLLEMSEETPRSIRAKARLLWSLGEMSKAIRTLEKLGKGRQLRHYRSEFATLCGLEPAVSSKPNAINGSNQQVLYLATNSLPYTGSGYAQRTQSVLSALRDIGWTVNAATRVNYPLNIGKIRASKSTVVGGIEYERFLPFPARSDFVGRVQQQTDALLEKVVREKPSILHTTTDFSNALAVKAVSEATGIPWVYEVRGQLADTWLSTRPASAEQSERYQRFVERESYVASHANHVFTLGEEMRNNLLDSGLNPSRVSLLPNGIGEKFIEEPVSKLSSRRELGLDPDAFYVGTVSSLVPYEGLSTVIRATAQIAGVCPQLRLLIVGDGTERENLMNLARELGIEDICSFPGRVPRAMAHMYHASLNVFVVPRIDSSVTRAVTPLKPVEALASNVPVVASDLPALRELITPGENGHLVPADDVPAWATVIQEMVADPEGCALMGKSGRDYVLKHRTWSQNAHHLNEVYERVISQAK